MKKYCLLSVLVLCMLLAGCSKNQLRCTYSTSDSFYGSDSVFVKYTFKKDGTIDYYSVNEKMVFNDAYLEQTGTTVDGQYNQALAYCNESVPQSKNIVCTVSKGKNYITVDIDYKLSKMTDEEIETMNLSSYLTAKKDDIKQQYSSQGFTCK